MKILVSACLIGLNTTYSGGNNIDSSLIGILKENHVPFYPLCTEQLGGLTTPREPAEIEKGYTSTDVLQGRARVLTENGTDVTKHYIKGAKSILKFCKEFQITHAILQERSPACGFTKVYDGTFSSKLIPGVGILTKLLIDNDIQIVRPEELNVLLKQFRE